jgi:SAM-dependent methyltransferase
MAAGDSIEIARPIETAATAPDAHPAIDPPGYSITAVIEEFNRRDQDPASALYEWQNRTHQYFQMQTARALLAALEGENCFPLGDKRMLDIGCGQGGWLLEFARWGASPPNLSGIEINPRRIDLARRRLPLARLHEGDARRLPWPAASFDILTQITVLAAVTSPAARREIAGEMLRVLRPGGLILSYDMRLNNPANDNVRALPPSEIRELFPGCRIEPRSLTLAPPLARRIVPVSWMLALALEQLPLLRTHCLAVIRKPTNAGGP